MPNLPAITVKPSAQKRLRQGHPWAYANEIDMDNTAKAVAAGGLVRVATRDGGRLGTAIFNRHSLIALRLLSRDGEATIDQAFFKDRLARALALRERLFDAPYYRLVHAEGDGLPGTVIDRFGPVLAVQLNTAGIQQLWPQLVAALEEVVAPRAIVLRNDSPARASEGLDLRVEIVKGELPGPLEVLENDTRYFADLSGGQKTGWFYDQRENRAWAARLAKGARVLDCYSFSGGFGIRAAAAGADEVTGLDSSEPALALARLAAEANGVASRCNFVRTDVMAELPRLHQRGERFDLVVADPPAYIKSKKHLAQGSQAYRKLVAAAAALVAPGGALVMASCSHHMDRARFAAQIERGIADAGRQARILREAGAGPDHPLHPALPETAYLKTHFLVLD